MRVRELDGGLSRRSAAELIAQADSGVAVIASASVPLTVRLTPSEVAWVLDCPVEDAAVALEGTDRLGAWHAEANLVSIDGTIAWLIILATDGFEAFITTDAQAGAAAMGSAIAGRLYAGAISG